MSHLQSLLDHKSSYVVMSNDLFNFVNSQGKSLRIRIDNERDNLLTEFGKATLKDRYLYNGETYQQLFARVATYYADNSDHAQRLYDYISQLWFMPATPILSNGGLKRGLPISCFLNEVADSLHGISDTYNENIWLAAKGGGIGTYWSNVRALGEKLKNGGTSSGLIPFVVVQDSLTLAISQGSLRRGSSAVYLHIEHPEVEEFLELRKPTGGDHNRKALNINHAICITDKFMEAVENDEEWNFLSPHTGEVISTTKARKLWIQILTTRIETGEPYLLFIDRVNELKPDIYKLHNLLCKTSNLCSEITLTTGLDHHNRDRTAVCCLSSLNLEKYDVWKGNDSFIEDVLRFLDNVLDDFISKATDEMSKAVYSAYRERSIGLGVMGFHSLLQSKNMPFESALAKGLNLSIFKWLNESCNRASTRLAIKKGACPDAKELNINKRFTHVMAIAPTASISIICGQTSPGIEPFAANCYMQKTLSGSFLTKNKFLEQFLIKKGRNDSDTWESISTNLGSVRHLDFLNDWEKDVFATAYEMDQHWIVEHAADRTPYICQAQSVNLFMPGDTHKQYLHDVHYQAWKKGLKSLYYLRSQTIQRGDSLSKAVDNDDSLSKVTSNFNSDTECLACQ